jgi:hypothetical protein
MESITTEFFIRALYHFYWILLPQNHKFWITTELYFLSTLPENRLSEPIHRTIMSETSPTTLHYCRTNNCSPLEKNNFIIGNYSKEHLHGSWLSHNSCIFYLTTPREGQFHRNFLLEIVPFRAPIVYSNINA